VIGVGGAIFLGQRKFTANDPPLHEAAADRQRIALMMQIRFDNCAKVVVG
jgi:hypothetical protein